MNDEQARDYYALIGVLVGHWPDMDEARACEIAAVVVGAGFTEAAA